MVDYWRIKSRLHCICFQLFLGVAEFSLSLPAKKASLDDCHPMRNVDINNFEKHFILRWSWLGDFASLFFFSLSLTRNKQLNPTYISIFPAHSSILFATHTPKTNETRTSFRTSNATEVDFQMFTFPPDLIVIMPYTLLINPV